MATPTRLRVRVKRWLAGAARAAHHYDPGEHEGGAPPPPDGVDSPPTAGDPAVQARIDAILQRVRDPESDLPLADLGLVRRVRFLNGEKRIYLDVPFDDHAPACLTCAGITMTLVMGIRRELTSAFETEFPGYRVEFI